MKVAERYSDADTGDTQLSFSHQMVNEVLETPFDVVVGCFKGMVTWDFSIHFQAWWLRGNPCKSGLKGQDLIGMYAVK